MTVYLVVWEDRHTDVAICVYSTLELAHAAIEVCKEYYDDEWEEQTEFKPPSRWLLDVVSTNDDGPKGRIEEAEVDAEPTL